MEMKRSKAFRFVPRCTESSTFLLFIVLLLSIITVSPKKILSASIEVPALGIFVFGLLLGSVFVLYYLFSGKKSTMQAQHFVNYTILMLTLIGVFSGIYSFFHAEYLLMIIFPIINIIQSIRMLKLLSIKNKMHDKLYLFFEDTKTQRWTMMTGTVIVIAIFLSLNILLHVYWAIAASISAVYIFSIHIYAENIWIKKEKV